MTRDILDAIDEAVEDWTVSKDAMRQGKVEAAAAEAIRGYESVLIPQPHGIGCWPPRCQP